MIKNRHGAQGVLDTASKATLENEFGTSNEDDCMVKILEGGMVQETEVRECLAMRRKRGGSGVDDEEGWLHVGHDERLCLLLGCRA